MAVLQLKKADAISLSPLLSLDLSVLCMKLGSGFGLKKKILKFDICMQMQLIVLWYVGGYVLTLDRLDSLFRCTLLEIKAWNDKERLFEPK